MGSDLLRLDLFVHVSHEPCPQGAGGVSTFPETRVNIIFSIWLYPFVGPIVPFLHIFIMCLHVLAMFWVIFAQYSWSATTDAFLFRGILVPTVARLILLAIMTRLSCLGWPSACALPY